MYEEINESISVVAIFRNGKAIPHSFSWRGRKYLVETVNLEHQEHTGGVLQFCFSIVSAGNSYELSFDSRHLVWTLERIWNS